MASNEYIPFISLTLLDGNNAINTGAATFPVGVQDTGYKVSVAAATGGSTAGVSGKGDNVGNSYSRNEIDGA